MLFPKLGTPFFPLVSFLLAEIATPNERKSDILADQSSGAVLAEGKLLNRVTKKQVEKLINSDVQVPLPKYELYVRANLGAYFQKPGSLGTAAVVSVNWIFAPVSEKTIQLFWL